MTAPVPVHEVTEWGRLEIPNCAAPTPGELALAKQLRGENADGLWSDEGSRLLLDWSSEGTLRVRARSWVGVVRLADREIRVMPKHTHGSLGVLTMLRYGHGAYLPDQLSSPRTLRGGDPNLLDLVCHLLATEAERIVRQGVLHDYVEHEEAIASLRGRLLIDRQLRRHFSDVSVVECRFDEHEPDILENQIVAAGLAAARRLCGDPGIRSRVRRLASAFAEVCSVASGVTAASEPFEYTHRNQHYAAGHAWSRLLIRQAGIHDLYLSGAPETQAFLLDMNVLFERFIAQALVDSAAGSDFAVERQASTGAIIVDALTGRTYTRVRPDVLIRHKPSGEVRPVDTKYKLYDERHVGPEDVYQAFLYAFAFHSGMGARQASLVYPSDRSAINQRLAVQGSGVTQATIRGVRVDLSGLVERAARAPIRDLDLIRLCGGWDTSELSAVPA